MCIFIRDKFMLIYFHDTFIFCTLEQDGSLSGPDYTAHMLLHLINDADTVNAKFLYLRVPEVIRKRSSTLNVVWDAAKALFHRNYGAAINALGQQFQSKAGNENKRQIDQLREVLVWHLRTHTVPDYFRKCYSNIELKTLKASLGAEKMSSVDFNKLISESDLLESDEVDSKGFVTIKSGPSSSAKADSNSVSFELTPERVLQLT